MLKDIKVSKNFKNYPKEEVTNYTGGATKREGVGALAMLKGRGSITSFVVFFPRKF